jgi:GMP synthase-like glutamine amidotransferase
MRTDGVRLAVLQHEPETGLGAFAGLLDEFGVEYAVVRTGHGPLPDASSFDGAIALGGSLHAYEPGLSETRRWIRNSVLRGLPFLGICLGGQLLATALGGVVSRGPKPELGVHGIFLTRAATGDPLLDGLPRYLSVFGWHEDGFELPREATHLASSIGYRQQAFRFGAAAYGLQFHPEVRVADLHRWARVAGYQSLRERDGRRWATIASELDEITPGLEPLSRQLLERWLCLVGGVTEVGGEWRRTMAA